MGGGGESGKAGISGFMCSQYTVNLGTMTFGKCPLCILLHNFYCCIVHRIEEGRDLCGCLSTRKVTRIVTNGSVSYQLTYVEGGGGVDRICRGSTEYSVHT